MRKIMLWGCLALATGAFFGCKKAAEAPQAAQPAQAAETHTAVGVIKEFGKDNKVVVIDHKDFADGFMKGMVMSFELKDPKLAEGLKAGDRVEFTLERGERSFPVVAIKKLK